jgi:hypothetical protein
MILPKSKYFIKNIIKTIHIEGTTIEIEAFYDTIHKGNRYSCTINHKKGIAVCGGYGKDNEIIYNTYESILTHILQNTHESTDIIRNFKLKIILNENN